MGPALKSRSHYRAISMFVWYRQQGVIAPLASIVVVAGSLLEQPIGLADGGVQVDGQRPVAGTGPRPPGSGQQLAADPVQLAHVAPTETAQEGPQGGRRLDRAAHHPRGPARAQGVGIVNAVATRQRRCHQRQQLVSGMRPTRRIPQVHMAVHQLTQTQMMGQGQRQQQAGVGHQAVVVEGDLDAVGGLQW